MILRPLKSLRRSLLALVSVIFISQFLEHGALAQRVFDIAPGYQAKAYLSAVSNGTTTLLLLSQPPSPDFVTAPSQPPSLELLSFDSAGSLAKRLKLDQVTADAVSPRGTSVCRSVATATQDGGFIVATAKPFEDVPLSTLATILKLGPDGRVLQKLDIGHPAFADQALRNRADVGLCVGIVSPGPDGSLLLAGHYADTLGTGTFHPWWAVFDGSGRMLSEAGREDQEGTILAAQLGEDRTLLTVRSRELERERAGRLSAEVSLRVQSPTGGPSKSAVLERNEFESAVVITDKEIAVLSISNRWTTDEDCSFPIQFFSREGRLLRSGRYSIAKRCESPPGEGRPEALLPDNDGFVALIEGDDYGAARIARFDRNGQITWRSPLAAYLAVARRQDGRLVALERTKLGLSLRNYP